MALGFASAKADVNAAQEFSAALREGFSDRGSSTSGRGYPPHLVPGNLYTHVWRGREQVGRHTACLVCGVSSNTRNRNGDARFIRAHRRCGFKA